MPEDNKKLFELGCGTGFFTEFVLNTRPNLEITSMDKSPWMLEIVRNKSELEGVKLILGNVFETWPSENYDVILTALNLHHFNNTDKFNLIKMIHGSLNKGGLFITADVFKPDTEFEEMTYRNMWFDSMIEAGFSEENAKSMIEMRKSAYDSIDTLEGYKRKLIDAGFRNICCPYVNYIYGIFVAYK
ncbi:class I SAM-dependent methyltransferase [Methanolobus sp. ZRKC2]|uniref:class I SAM-dependent methyltransferase n=1 Tax=Methanolobus sp. ZRKC2 TaxID=3125783 RepID=UPI00324D7854